MLPELDSMVQRGSFGAQAPEIGGWSESPRTPMMRSHSLWFTTPQTTPQ
jgi:hypothetical protein